MKTKKKIHLEGGVIVEMKNGEEHYLLFGPVDGKIAHHGPGAFEFDPATVTDEEEFRNSIKRVVSRSTFDRR